MVDCRPADVLLIDPNPEDTQLFLDALESQKVANHVHTVSTGAEALDFLHQRRKYADAPRPQLILLEIDLPEMDGYQLLEQLDDEPELAATPVIVLTGSDDAKAIVQSYDLDVNAHIPKPVDVDEFLDTVRSIESFWLRITWLPAIDTDGEDDEPSY